MSQKFDVFIIGGGPAGQKVAHLVRQAGFSVGISEHRGFGGTCALRGCDPKRIMLTVAEATDSVDKLQGHGVAGEVSMNWTEVRGLIEDILGDIPERAEDSLKAAGITPFTQPAHFIDEHTLRVGEAQVTAKHIVIATGQRPAPLDIPGAAFAKTSDDFHKLPAIPPHVLFVGGGYIGLESAHICKRIGAEVTIIHNDEDPLPMFEPAFADSLIAVTRSLGIKLKYNTTVTAIEKSGTGFSVSVKDKDGKIEKVIADLVMNTTGRIPNLESLQLQNAHINFDKAGILVDDYLCVKGKQHIYAVGDVAVTDGPPLTPVASIEAKAVAKTIGGEPTKPIYTGLPTAVYARPELAGVGLTEEAARELGYDIEVVEKLDATHQYNAKRTKARAYGYKTVVDKATNTLLGATIIGPRASEVINVFALAIRAKINVDHLRETPYAYPTWGSDVSGMV